MFEELFRQYYDTGQQHVQYMLCNKHQDEWDVHRSCLYSNGVVLGKYRENDKLTINVLQSKLPTEDLCRVLKINNANDLKALLRSGKTDCITTEKINLHRKQADELSSLSIEEFINKNHRWLIDECKRKGDIDLEKVIKLAYLYFSYALFETNENAPFSKHQDNIKALFESKGIELPSYEKYELVPLDQDRKIILVEPPRIYDKSIDKTLFIQNVPIPLLVQLKKMLDKDMFKQVSYRVKNNKVFDGRYNLGILLEEVEFGKVFSLTDLGVIKLSKLYSNSYEDCLWIKSDSSNITFEELCDDFEEYEGHIVTQVIHIEYSWHKEKAYITHIDHEYIFYTLDEYANRIKDADQKGAASTRIKTFKVDDAMIPLDYSLNVSWKDQNGIQLPSVNILFLHFVLENYFRHSDILREYFGEPNLK